MTSDAEILVNSTQWQIPSGGGRGGGWGGGGLGGRIDPSHITGTGSLFSQFHLHRWISRQGGIHV